MFNNVTLIQSVVLLAVLVLLGTILKKAGLANDQLTKGFGDVVIYLAQPAMIIYSFVRIDFTMDVLYTSLMVLVFATIFHFMYFGISLICFRKGNPKRLAVLRFATVFSNTGFMGIPLVSQLLGDTAAIYASFYVIVFNFLSWTLGCYMYTGDKKYISVKKTLINPATIPTYIGLFLFVTQIHTKIPASIWNIFAGDGNGTITGGLFLLKACVLPLSMMMIGIRLADCNIKETLHDKVLPFYLILRLLFVPFIVWAIMFGIIQTGLLPAEIMQSSMTVILICCSTPAAAMATIFAEKFNGDALYASEIVSVSSLLSMVTMPLIALLLKI